MVFKKIILIVLVVCLFRGNYSLYGMTNPSSWAGAAACASGLAVGVKICYEKYLKYAKNKREMQREGILSKIIADLQLDLMHKKFSKNNKEKFILAGIDDLKKYGFINNEQALSAQAQIGDLYNKLNRYFFKPRTNEQKENIRKYVYQLIDAINTALKIEKDQARLKAIFELYYVWRYPYYLTDFSILNDFDNTWNEQEIFDYFKKRVFFCRRDLHQKLKLIHKDEEINKRQQFKDELAWKFIILLGDSIYLMKNSTQRSDSEILKSIELKKEELKLLNQNFKFNSQKIDKIFDSYKTALEKKDSVDQRKVMIAMKDAITAMENTLEILLEKNIDYFVEFLEK